MIPSKYNVLYIICSILYWYSFYNINNNKINYYAFRTQKKLSNTECTNSVEYNEK